MANGLIDFSTLTQKQQLAIQSALLKIAQDAEDAPTEVDVSNEPVVMVSHAKTPVAYVVKGDNLVTADGTVYGPDVHKGFAISPVDGAKIGFAPVLYNGQKIESLEHHVGLRVGDSATLAQYVGEDTAALTADDAEDVGATDTTVTTGGKK